VRSLVVFSAQDSSVVLSACELTRLEGVVTSLVVFSAQVLYSVHVPRKHLYDCQGFE